LAGLEHRPHQLGQDYRDQGGPQRGGPEVQVPAQLPQLEYRWENG